MSGKLKKWIILFLRFGFGLLLIFASIDKILHPVEFAQAVENYRVISIDLSRWAAVWIPHLEVVVGVLLITGIWLDSATLINSILMGIFLILVGQAWLRGLDINCGCFQIDEPSSIDFWKILQNVGFLVGSIVLLINVNKKS